eukprot:RCo033500
MSVCPNLCTGRLQGIIERWNALMDVKLPTKADTHSKNTTRNYTPHAPWLAVRSVMCIFHCPTCKSCAYSLGMASNGLNWVVMCGALLSLALLALRFLAPREVPYLPLAPF